MPGESVLPGKWWYDETNRNFLKGIPGDPENPAIISDEEILYYLYRVPKARTDFNIIFETLLPEEQERLTLLIENNPNVRYLLPDWEALDKDIANMQNTHIPSILLRG
jgi:hypothetical protein